MLGQVPRTTTRIFRVQKRSLASSVLSTTAPERWQEQTLSQLRNEARTRGLATTGPKSKIIERLVAHAHSDKPVSLTEPVRQRWISSSSTLHAEVDTDKFKPRWSRNLDVKLPETPEEADEGPVIPFLAQKFDSPPSESASPPQELPDGAPKVLTVASAATHIGGGPSHAIHEPVDPHTIEDSSEQSERSSFSLREVLAELGLPLSVDVNKSSKAVREALEPALANIGVPEIRKDTTNTKEAQRELNQEEQRGLYVLGGIVVGGLVLGGLGNKKSTVKKH